MSQLVELIFGWMFVSSYCIVNYEYFPFFIRFSHFHSQWTLNEHTLHMCFFLLFLVRILKKTNPKTVTSMRSFVTLGFYCYTKPPSFSFSLKNMSFPFQMLNTSNCQANGDAFFFSFYFAPFKISLAYVCMFVFWVILKSNLVYFLFIEDYMGWWRRWWYLFGNFWIQANHYTPMSTKHCIPLHPYCFFSLIFCIFHFGG